MPMDRLEVRKIRLENAKNIAQILALIFAGVWGAYWGYINYVMPELLRPDDYQPHLVTEARMELLEIFPDRAVFSLNTRIANQSARFLRNVGAFYRATGSRTQNRGERDDTEMLKDLVKELHEDPQRVTESYLLPRKRVSLISAGRVMPDRSWLAPSEEYTQQIVMPVPCEMDVVRVTMTAVYHIYHYEDGQKFKINWKQEKGSLWFDLMIKENDEFVLFDYESEKHEEIRKEYGLQWSETVHEASIPVSYTLKGHSKCSATNFSVKGSVGR